MINRVELAFAVMVVAFLFTSPTAGAAVIYGDIAGSSIDSGYNVGPGGLDNAIPRASRWQAITPSIASIFTSKGFTRGTGSNLALSICSAAGNKPGVDLYNLSTNVTGTAGVPTLETFSGTGSFPLVAGTKHWLDLYATNPSASSGNIIEWNAAFNAGFAGFATPTGPGATEIGQERSVGGGNPTRRSAINQRIADRISIKRRCGDRAVVDCAADHWIGRRSHR
jgi:hypothetical protein